MTMETRLNALAQAIGADIKNLRDTRGDLTSLSTTAKGNVVAAINEIFALVGAGGVQIDDGAGNGDTDVTWSADRIFDAIELAKAAVKSELIGGASAALDTFKELQDALGNDPTFAATISTALTKRVRIDAVQTLTTAERLQACQNIGIGDPEADFVAAYNTAKA